ncbi:MAG: EFR1 family ferrodoxin [Clostridia bacterium]|nr:EFR1 family ferrodoxin [Clostridia bacterium]
MVGIYFSGTGNTRRCVEKLVTLIDGGAKSFAVEDERAAEAIKNADKIIFGYPVYFSNVPKIVREFIENNGEIFRGKKVFIVCTMGLFSGDGADCGARLLKKRGAKILGGLHVKMPDCIGDNPLLKKPREKNRALIRAADEKINLTAERIKSGNFPKDGLSVFARIAGLFGQRLYFYNKPRRYCKTVKADAQKCVKCGKCEGVCPMKNISVCEKGTTFSGRCTTCYRCFSKCPKGAITVMGKRVYTQYKAEDYE